MGGFAWIQNRIRLEADAIQGQMKRIVVTLSPTPGTVTVITIPDGAQGFRLYPRGNDASFAVNEAPGPAATSSNTTISASAFTTGNTAKADMWEVRLVDDGADRTVQLESETASVVVEVQVF